MTRVSRNSPAGSFGARIAVGLLGAIALFLPGAARGGDLPVIDRQTDLSQWEVNDAGNLLTYDPVDDVAASVTVTKSGMRQRGIALELGRVTGSLRLESGARRMSLPVGAEEHFITLDPMLVWVDGDADAAQSRAWRDMLSDGRSPSVTITFAADCRPTMRIVREDAAPVTTTPPDDTDASRPTIVQPTDGRAVALSRSDAMLLEARKAVLPMHIKTDTPTVRLRSSAIVISPDGFAVTQYHPLHGAEGATVTVRGIEEPQSVELWSAEPSLDLALIKLPKGVVAKAGVHAMPLAERGPQVEQTVWLLGLTYDGRPTVSVGAVQAIASHTQLSPQLRRALPFEHVSQWVQTTAPVTVTDSGGPLVNAGGELVAMAVWTWPQPQQSSPSSPHHRRGSRTPPPQTYMALSGNHVRALYERRPGSAITFERARSQFALARSPHMRLPRIDLAGETTPANLRRAAQVFADTAVCAMCDGEGKVELEKESRDRMLEQLSGRNPKEVDQQRANEQARTIDCPRCNGLGFEKPETLLRLGKNVVEALATTDPTHPLVQREYVNVHMKLREALADHPSRLAEPLNTEARRHLHRMAPRVGTPILFFGAKEKIEELEDHPGRPLLMSLGDAEPRMIVHDTVVYDHNLNDIVLVGGLLAGFVSDETGNLVPVIEGGFAINIPKTVEEEQDERKLTDEQRKQQAQQSARERYRKWMERRRQIWRDRWNRNRSRRSSTPNS